ncbi:cystathionine gamma-lyase [Bombyx mori]|uniref:cystathionine gamma-lyase n=1 Tax=Bombyx mori TaxID=7091 RepID=Q2F6B7_BOMMO|nr:cystathionine gamma-lyase [Bombyx mori]ABD36100.1 cystathionine gamma-lyase [Bombyx mori]
MADHGFLKQKPGFATIAIHAGQEPEKWNSAAVVTPIVTSTTFKQPAPAEHTGFEYGRSGNPTRNTLEECLAALDGGKYGLTFASGLGATTTLVALLNHGDHIVSSDDVYGGTNRLLRQVIARLGINTTFTDFTNIEKVKNAMQENTKMIWIETPTNPLLKVVDIEAIVKIARSRGDIIVVVDNTFLTPYLQKPLDFGADIVMYSLTKYMNGHSDVIMGAAIVNDKAIGDKLRFLQNAMGIVPSPIDCYFVNRSLKTLALRMEHHKKSSLIIANWLEKHPKIVEVLHPGLPTHPQHEIAKKQMTGHSGVFSFKHSGGLKESRKFLSSLKVFTLAESLGGYESLAELPSVMTHASVPALQREELGITDSLVRLSVGLEDTEDLIEDLDQAFKAAF